MTHDSALDRSWVDVPPDVRDRAHGRSLDPFGPDPDDAVLVAALVEAPPTHRQLAFGLLYTRHADAVRAVCANQLRGDPDSVEDLTQETFLRLLHHAGGLHSPGSVLAWLRRTAKWACRDHRNLARNRLEQPSNADLGGQRDDFAALLVDADRVERLLARLEQRHAAVLRAHYLDGVAIAEIARLLGITVGAVKTTLYRARIEGRRLVETGKAMIPLPLLDFFNRAGEVIKSVASPGLAAAALIPLVAATVLLAPPPLGEPAAGPPQPGLGDPLSQPAALPVSDAAPATPQPADRPATAPVSTTTNPVGDSDAGVEDDGANDRYVPPSSPTREVQTPVIGPVQTYEEPATPPDRHIVVAPDATGDLVGVRNHDEPELYPAYDAGCEASAAVDVVDCRH